MRKELGGSAFFEAEIAAEAKLLSEALLETLDNDPVPIKDERLRDEVKWWTAIMEEYQRYGWSEESELSLADMAVVEYLPFAMMWRLADQASESMKHARHSRPLRMFEAVAEKLGLGNDPRRVQENLNCKIDLVLTKYEDENRFDILEVTSIVGRTNEALFPSAW